MLIFHADCLNNFGDVFTREYFNRVHGKDFAEIIPPENPYEQMFEDVLVGAGSILNFVGNGRFNGTVLGTGIMYAPERADLKNATVLAVRGKLTAARVQCNTDFVLGDLGLLASDIPFEKPEKSFSYGIIPHFVDRDHHDVVRWSRRDDTLVIDIRGGVRNVLEQTSRCEKIVSSSLHGLILADSLGIPNSWIELGGRVAGNGFKFRDYYSVYNEIVEPTFIEDGFDRARMYPLVEPTKNVLRSVVQNFVDSLE